MKRFKNILVVVDEASSSNAVLERARWLAQRNGAVVSLVDVIDADPGELTRILSALPGPRALEVEAQVIATHSDRLEGMAAPLRDAGIEVHTEVLNGPGFLQIIRRVLAEEHDLVLKAADRGPDRPFLRAPDLHLLRKCPCPVWILNGETHAKARRIMVAVDPDPQDTVRNTLDRMVMQLGTSLAAQDEAKLDVVNAWHLQEESTLSHGRVRMCPEELGALLNNEESQSKQRLDTLIAEFGSFSDVMRVLHIKGIAADVIPEHVESESIDTLVMGTVGRTGISGFFIGNTAETILNRVSCSVLAVKPEGFISPVKQKDEA